MRSLPARLVAAQLLLVACGGQTHSTYDVGTAGDGGSSAGAGSGGKGSAVGGSNSRSGTGGGGAGSPGGNAGQAGTGASPTGLGGAGGNSGQGGVVAGMAGVAGFGGIGGLSGAAGAAGNCNQLTNLAPHASCVVWSGEPLATGGIIPDGTYYLESISSASGCILLDFAQTLRLTQTGPTTYTMEAVSNTPVHANSTWTTSGTQASSVFTCGVVDGNTWNYSVLNDLSQPRFRLSQATSAWTYVRVGN